jgi:chemotaxis protein CheD
VSATPPLGAAQAGAVPHQAHYVHPGQLFASAEPHQVTTILGTCVAVCLFDAHAKVGGLNHYLLPNRVGTGAGGRFGASAMELLLDRVQSLGAMKSRLRAKVFGGADGRAGSAGELGKRNVALAYELLEQAGVPVIAADHGGPSARKLIFQTDDGVAWVKYLQGEAR